MKSRIDISFAISSHIDCLNYYIEIRDMEFFLTRIVWRHDCTRKGRTNITQHVTFVTTSFYNCLRTYLANIALWWSLVWNSGMLGLGWVTVWFLRVLEDRQPMLSSIRAHITLSQAITDTQTSDHSITENDDKTIRIISLRTSKSFNPPCAV